MELDTGEAISVIGSSLFTELFKGGITPNIKPINLKLRTYTDQVITPIGLVVVKVIYDD